MIKSRLRFFLGYVISLYLILTGKVSSIIKKALNGEIILSIYFHNPRKKTVRCLIDWLQNNGFHFISAEELIDILKTGKNFPKGAVFLSIDDGWRKNISNVFEIVGKSNIPITLFPIIEPIINSNGFWWSYVDKGINIGLKIPEKENLKLISNAERIKIVEKVKSSFLIKDEAIGIEDLKIIAREKSITIGSHTYSHPILICCNEKELEFEIGESKTILEELIKSKVKYFAYPNGKHRKREMDCVKKIGYEAAFGTDPDYIMTTDPINLFNIPRFEIRDDASLRENICRLTGVWYRSNLSKRDNA